MGEGYSSEWVEGIFYWNGVVCRNLSVKFVERLEACMSMYGIRRGVCVGGGRVNCRYPYTNVPIT